MANRLDILLLGATGFTGMYCIPYLHKLTKTNRYNLTWGVAGRSESKLKDTLQKMGDKTGVDFSKIPIVTCDITNKESLLKMARKTKIVINCCGPFTLLGEAVVKACIEAGTHHVDISGEPQYMKKVELEQNQAAKNKGVYIVSACGMDCVPADLGVIYLQQHFEGVLNSVVIYLEGWEKDGTVPGSLLNYGTWTSTVHAYATWNTLKNIRKKLYPTRLPTFKPSLKKKFFPHRPSVVDGWSLPFITADRFVTRDTQRYFYEKESRRPAQIDTQFIVKSFYRVILYAIIGAVFAVLGKFSFGRTLLLNYPEFFTGGLVNKDPPIEEKIENVWVQLTLYGEGWKGKLSDNQGQFSTPPNKAIIGRVKGRNPGYGLTCACVVGAAIMIATEKDKLPNNGKGGVYTPGVAFAKTSFINLLTDNEVKFEIFSQKDLR